MNRRPLVFVAAIVDGQSFAWLMPPGMEPSDDGVLQTTGHHIARADGPAIDLMTTAECTRKTMPLETILHGVNWLVRDITGDFLIDER